MIPKRFAAQAVVGMVGMVGACGFRPSTGATSGDDASNAALDGATSGSDGGVEVLGPCGSPGAIRDDFTGTTIANQWRATGTTSQSGELAVSPSSGVNFAGYTSKHAVDLRGAEVRFEVTQMVDTNSFALAAVYLFADATHYVGIIQQNGNLYLQADGGGGPLNSAMVTYSPSLHRWWRITEAAGTITAETSPDQLTWTALGTAATPTWANRLQIGLGGYSDGSPHGSVHFDNLDQDTTAHWCKATTFSDTFARSNIGFDWSARNQGGGCVASVNNGAHFDQSGPGSSRCILATTPGFDLTESHAMVYVGAITNSRPGWTAFLRGIADDVTTAFLIQYDFTTTPSFCAQIGSAAETCLGYNGSYLYWRISEHAGTLTFDTSADAATWTTVLTGAVPAAVTAIEFQIGTQTTASIAPSIPLTISSYNTP